MACSRVLMRSGVDLGAQPASALGWPSLRLRPVRVVSAVLRRSIWACCWALDGARFLERHLVLLGALHQLGDLAVAIEQQPLGLDSRASTLGRRSADGLLQHAAGVLVFLQIGLVLPDVALQRRDAGIAPVDVDQVAGALELGWSSLRLELVHLDGVFGAQAGRDRP
jgi:hypothetical protein